MATVVSDKVVSSIPARDNSHVGLVSVTGSFTIPATGDGTAAGDVIQMVKAPKGATIIEVIVAITDVETDAGVTHRFDVGDGGDVDRFIDGSSAGNTGGIARLGDGVAAAVVDNAHGFTYTEDDTIDILIVAASTAKAAGVVKLTAIYTTGGV